jgi:hypothetical protein
MSGAIELSGTGSQSHRWHANAFPKQGFTNADDCSSIFQLLIGSQSAKNPCRGDTVFDPMIAVATYNAGAKLDCHSHPGGQVLLITEGTGYYQERGKGHLSSSQRGCRKKSSGC